MVRFSKQKKSLLIFTSNVCYWSLKMHVLKCYVVFTCNFKFNSSVLGIHYLLTIEDTIFS